ncbi:Sodium-dependent dicarboxylate transporter SdcS [Roseimaritima multifibrata]|uniref:Sodium-dependent dicarboxylate transporter SdcS n=2 Tax=Roseimaritima multifibrata TaxID=1930274 RepID=A0A517MJC8_9BACT|nr:Sodium-dependent dicarboxylate transporter SdcS [Roseimaritima multifibrata]
MGGPILAVLVFVFCFQSDISWEASCCAGVATLCAVWWILETLDLAVVGIVPFVAFPVLGVLSASDVAGAYGHSMILLLLGGAFLSAGMEKCGAHRRLALYLVRAVGGSNGRRLVLGVMLATAGLSMWISNTATALMMLPIAMAILSQIEDDHALRTALLLGIAYAASIGGMGTPIGTPPNVLMVGYVQETFGHEVTFFDWMQVTLPIVLVLLPVTWLWITRKLEGAHSIQMPDVGVWRQSEVRVLIIFVVTALAWVFRAAPAGGWSSWIPVTDSDGRSMINDATIALAASLALFIVPAGDKPAEPVRDDSEEAPPRCTERLLDWKATSRVPWGILLMFGGGLALAQGFETSGLSQIVGTQLSRIADQPPWLLMLVLCLVVTFLTEITSGTATTSLLLPVLGGMSIVSGLPYELILYPAAISASCAFMLPVASPPNTIVFATGSLSTQQMARTGLGLNLIAAFLISTVCYFLIPTSDREPAASEAAVPSESQAAGVR